MLLSVTNLTKKFESGWWTWSKKQSYLAVNNISFDLKQGEILGFLGPNGAGKTTTIQMLLGTLTPSNGHIAYFGQNFAQHQSAILKKIGYASGYDKLPARLTIYENLDIVARIYGIEHSQRAQAINLVLQNFSLEAIQHRPTGALSAGQSTRVMLAKAFIAQPQIVILDEPTASLDPDVANEVRQFILQQRRKLGTAVLITSHNMAEVAELCDRVIVLQQGAIIANDTPAMLTQSITQAHLHLTINEKTNLFTDYLQNKQMRFVLHENLFRIEIPEQEIAPFLVDLGKQQITYSQISIDKPTLEDYFLSIARRQIAKDSI